MSQVILVNSNNEPIGEMEKMEVHEKGLLHRAFSVFIFNKQGEMLLQQRAQQKYHSPQLWTNACCSHPMPGEETEASAHRRLKEELGFDTALTEVFSFTYQSVFDNGLTEHEFDHVFTGVYDGVLLPNPEEVKDHCFMKMEDIRKQIKLSPQQYTSWFKIAFPKLEVYLASK